MEARLARVEVVAAAAAKEEMVAGLEIKDRDAQTPPQVGTVADDADASEI